jgi:hypothetical protein
MKEDKGINQLAEWIERVTSGWVLVEAALHGKGKKHRFLQVLRALPTETKVESEISQSTSGTSVDSSNLGDLEMWILSK